MKQRKNLERSPIEPNNERPLSRTWQRTATLGALAIGLVETGIARLNNLGTLIDGAHNIVDAATYYMQSETVINDDMSPKRRRLLKKLSYAALSLPSLGFGAQAMAEMATSSSHEASHHTISATAASVALNGLLYARLHRRRHNEQLQNSGTLKHLYVDTSSSVVALAGSIAEQAGYDRAESVAAMATGFFTAWAFRPTEKNLNEPHVCALHPDGHNHDHEHAHSHGHHHDHEHSRTHESHPPIVIKEIPEEVPTTSPIPAFVDPFSQSAKKYYEPNVSAIKNDAIWKAHEAFGTW